MKNIYSTPTLTVIELRAEDVLTTSIVGAGIQNDDIGRIRLNIQ